MALSINNIKKLHKCLEYNFLYKDDLKSMHLLLSILENEIRLKKLKPNYICMKGIKRSLARTLYYRSDSDLIQRDVRKLINDPVNKLELSMYIDAYFAGYQDKEWADKLERKALEFGILEGFSGEDLLFHLREDYRILELKESLYKDLDSRLDKSSRVERITYSYCEKTIKDHVFDLNDTVDTQLELGRNTIKKHDKLLTIPELTTIYQNIVSSFSRNLRKIYKYSYWYGVNDRVLNRYE